MLLVVGVAVIALGGAFYAYRTLRPDPDRQSRDLQEKQRQMELDTIAARQQERIALTKARLKEVSDSGGEALSRIKEFEDELKLWDREVRALLTNETGKSLAASTTFITAFQNIYSRHRPGPAEAEAIRGRVVTLLEPVQRALASETAAYAPSDELRQEISREKESVLRMIAEYRESRLQIAGMVEQATRAHPPASVTLERAVADLAAKHAAEKAEKIANAEEEARKKSDEVLAKTRADQIEQAALDEKNKIDAKTKADKIKADIESKTVVSEAEKAQLIKRCQDPDVRQTLAPFLDKGHFKPSDNMHGSRRYDSPQPVPVSYGDLQKLGALNPTADGLKMLHKIATAPVDTMRTRWPGYRKRLQDDPALRELVPKGQQLLVELGQTMVELGMLQP